MLFHAPVKRAAAEAELGRRKRNIEMVHPERALDHLLLELVEVQAARPRDIAHASGRTAGEIVEP